MNRRKLEIILIVILVLLNIVVAFHIFRAEFIGRTPKQHKSLKVSMVVPVQETSVVHRQFNFHVVKPGIWRSAMPNQHTINTLKGHGLKTVLSLLSEKEDVQFVDKDYLEAQGIRYVHIPLDMFGTLDDKRLHQAVEIMNDPDTYPLLVHCLGGKDRTGLVVAMYKMKYMDVAFKDAYLEMMVYGHSGLYYRKLFNYAKYLRDQRGLIVKE